MENSTIFDFALEYLNFGWSVIPVGQDKRPLVEWKKYQDRRATREEITDWFTDKYPNANIGVVTGKISNIIVVDIDPRHGGTDKDFQKFVTIKSKTGGGGWHYFFQFEEGIQNQAGFIEGIDVRGEGGFVVVPPSIHESGQRYEWLMSPQAHTPIIQLPDDIKNTLSRPKLIILKTENINNQINELLGGVREGKRNTAATSIVGKLLSTFAKKDWEGWVWPLFLDWNGKNQPPLTEKELRIIFDSISSKETLKEIPKPKFEPILIENLMMKKFSETKWIVEKLIPAECIVAISGAPSVFKTWLLIDIMLKISHGLPLYDKFLTKKQGCLYIDEETGERWMQERFFKFRIDENLPLFLLSKSGFKLTDNTADWVINYSKNNDIGLVVFDSLVRISTAQDENNASEISKVFSLFQKLNKAGLTVIFAHHHRKQNGFRGTNISQDMRGSSDILAGVDCHLAVEREDNSIIITQTKLRQEKQLKPFELKIINESASFRFEFIGECNEWMATKTSFKKAIEEFLSKSDREICKTELFRELKKLSVKGGKSSFKGAIDEMIKDESIFTKQGAGNKVIVSLKPFDIQESLINE